MKGIFDSLRRLIDPLPQAPDHPADKPILSAVKEPKQKPEPAPEQERQDPYRDKPAPAAPPPKIVIPAASVAPGPEPDSVDAAKEAVESCKEDDPKFAQAFDIVLNDADTISELRWLFGETSKGGSPEARVLDKLKGLDLGFDDWKEACVDEGELNAWSGACFAKAISTAKTDEDWIALWEYASDYDEAFAELKKALAQTDWPESEWESLRDEAESGGSLESFAFIQILGLKSTPQDILRFYFDYVENWDTDDDVTDAIFEKLFGLATRQEVQIISVMAGEDDALREAADEHLKS